MDNNSDQRTLGRIEASQDDFERRLSRVEGRLESTMETVASHNGRLKEQEAMSARVKEMTEIFEALRKLLLMALGFGGPAFVIWLISQFFGYGGHK